MHKNKFDKCRQYATDKSRRKTQRSNVMNDSDYKEAFKAKVRGAIREKCTELTASGSGAIGYNEGKNIVEFIEP